MIKQSKIKNVYKYFKLPLTLTFVVICFFSCEQNSESPDNGNKSTDIKNKIYYNKIAENIYNSDNPRNYNIIEFDEQTKLSNIFKAHAMVLCQGANDLMAVMDSNNYYIMKKSDRSIVKILHTEPYYYYQAKEPIVFLKNGRCLIYQTQNDNYGNVNKSSYSFLDITNGTYPGTLIENKYEHKTLPLVIQNESKIVFANHNDNRNNKAGDSLFTLDLQYPYTSNFICDGLTCDIKSTHSMVAVPGKDEVIALTALDNNDNNQLVLIDLNTKKKKLLTNDNYKKVSVTISPDGKTILYAVINVYSKGIILYTMDFNGNKLHQIFGAKFVSNFNNYIWLNNNQLVFAGLYTNSFWGLSQVWMIDLKSNTIDLIGKDISLSKFGI